MNNLLPETDFGAEFSECRKYRYALWRIWDRKLPMAMFIGLNPSSANETDPDPTIKSVGRISRHNGFGGLLMVNCFPMISTDPSKLTVENTDVNREKLIEYSEMADTVVFAWGNFKEPVQHGADKVMAYLFPEAMCIGKNKNGSPKHPLYCETESH